MRHVFLYSVVYLFSYHEKAINALCKPKMETGRVEHLRPTGQAGQKTGQILLSCNYNTPKHQSK